MWRFPDYHPGQPLDWQKLVAKFDWLAAMQGVPQDPEWHAEGDVFTHTKMVVEALISLPEFQALAEQDQHILITAALLHDVEKRSTTAEQEENGKIRIISPTHAKKGEFTARCVLYRDIPTPFAMREQIAKLVRWHGLPLWAIEKSEPAKAVIEASLWLNTQHLAMLAKADVLGRICPDQADLLLKIDLFQALCQEHHCWGNAYPFSSDLARYHYLSHSHAPLDYIPFDDFKCEVHLLSALPGSGKDTFIERSLSHLPTVSLDDIRRANGIVPTDKKGNGQVIQLAKEACKALLRQQRDFVFNATNITKEMRGKWISLFESYGAKITIHYIEVPYQRLITQNRNRHYSVPDDVVSRMLEKLEMPAWHEAHRLCFHITDA